MTGPDDTGGEEGLDRITERLATDLGSLVDRETVGRLVKSSHELLAGRCEPADRTAWEGLLHHTERFARDRLVALAKSEGRLPGSTPGVLFLCVRNAGRSQMALGWLRHLAGQGALAWSGGSAPGSGLDPNAEAAMAEVGIDISGEFPKPWTDEIVRGADLVVTMGCGDACPVVPGQRYEDWALPDPAGRPIDEVRPIRDEIGRRVGELLGRLGVRSVEGIV